MSIHTAAVDETSQGHTIRKILRCVLSVDLEEAYYFASNTDEWMRKTKNQLSEGLHLLLKGCTVSSIACVKLDDTSFELLNSIHISYLDYPLGSSNLVLGLM